MRNFGIVVPGLLYRSGKYTLGALSACVSEYKIKRVIDLRSRAPLFKQASYAKIGVEFIRFPIDEYEIFIVVPEIEKPTLIHCWRGAHRTGAVVAKYRINVCGWTKRQAYDEMMHFGFGDVSKHTNLFVSVFGGWRP